MTKEVSPATETYHYGPACERGKNMSRSEHLVLLYDCELYPERESVHYAFFEALLRSWEAINGGP